MGISIARRESTGRTKRSLLKEIPVDAMPAEVKRLRDVALAMARDAVWGTPLGLLFIEGTLSAEQFQAGRRYAEAARAYQAAIGAVALQAKGNAIGAASSRESADPDTDAGRREARRHRAAMRAFEAIKEALPTRLLRVVRAVCEDDRTPDSPGETRDLRLGLSVLAAQFGLTDRAGAAYGNNRG
jgi:hypothetical protein